MRAKLFLTRHIFIRARGWFFKHVDKKEGVVISFADPHGLERPGVINRVLGDSLEIDFNHPLAGKDLVFEVEVLEVETVSNEILRS